MATTKSSTTKTPATRKPAAKPATAKAPAKSTAAKPASPRAAPKSAPRKPAAAAAPKAAAKPKAAARPKAAAKPTPSLPSRALGVFSIGAATVAIGAAIVETVRRLRGRGTGGHSAPDLALDHDRSTDDRAPDAFRPDPTASVPASEREALRPATLPLDSGRALDSVH
jgi:hypothetical protein